MAESKENEFQNFYKILRLVNDAGATTVKRKLISIFPNSNLQDILGNTRHTLYHLWTDQKCCQCIIKDLSGKPLILDDSQWSNLFTSHSPACQTNCSCRFTADLNITLENLDLYLLLRLIENAAPLTPDEISYLKDIDSARCLLDTASSTWRLPDTDFDHHWRTLSESIIKLAGTYSETDKKGVEKFIETLESMENTPERNKEAENVYRLITLIVDSGTPVLRVKFMDQFPNQTFEEILNINKHNLFHLWQRKKCCSCGPKDRTQRNKVLFRKEWDELYTRSKISCSTVCCCCYSARQDVKIEDTDVTLISCLLLNIATLNANESSLVLEIREAKNNINSHMKKVRLSDDDFSQKWQRVSQNIKTLAKTCKTKHPNCPHYLDTTLRETEKVKTRDLDSSSTKKCLKHYKDTTMQPEMMEKMIEIRESLAAIKGQGRNSGSSKESHGAKMAQDSKLEFDNYCKIGRLLQNVGAATVKNKLKSGFPSSKLHDILANKRHILYHLWNDQKCCNCINDEFLGKVQVFDDGQWSSLFTSQSSACQTNCSCSFTPVPNLTIDSLDLKLLLCLIANVTPLNPDEISCLKSIDATRCFLDSARSTCRLPDIAFDSHWSMLSENITRLAETCSPADRKDVERQIEQLMSMEINSNSHEEAQNFYKLIALITNNATAVLQVKFMDQFPNQTMEKILNNNTHHLYHQLQSGECCKCGSIALDPERKPLSHIQWNLLFKKSKPDCSKATNCCCCYISRPRVRVEDTDVTLISCLLFNIGKLNGFERSLVKYIREEKQSIIRHINRTRLSDAYFSEKWKILSQNIENLAKTCKTKIRNCPQYIDTTLGEIKKLKTSVQDNSLTEKAIKKEDIEVSSELMEQFVELNEEIAEFSHEFQKVTKEELTKVCEISAKFIKQTTAKSAFVRTTAFELAIKKIKEGNRFIMFLGFSGDGKTTHAIHLIENMINGRTVFQEKKRALFLHEQNHFQKLELISPDGNLVVGIDDMFGRYSAPLQTIRNWKGYLTNRQGCFAEPLNTASNYLIITMRRDIYNVCKESLKDLAIYDKCVIIDMTSPDLCLHEEEKITIFRSLIPITLVGDNQLEMICKGSKQLGFPQCCKMFSENPEFQNSPESFFKDPIACLKSDLKKMFDGLKKERKRFCVLALIAFHGGCLKVESCHEQKGCQKDNERLKNATIICGINDSNIIGNKLLDNAQSFVGVYVEYNEQKGEYTFSHSSVEEAIVNLMFERNAMLMIESCKLSHFSHFSQNPERSFSTFVSREVHYEMIMQRISEELEVHEHTIFSTLADMDLWRDDKFKKKVLETLHCEDFGLHYHMQGGTNDSLSLLVCGSRAGNHYLLEFLMKLKPSNNQLQRALDIAGQFGREQVFFFLLKNGANPNIRTFFHVIKSGNINLFNHLLGRNIDFSEECDLQFPNRPISVFGQICVTGNIEMAKVFLSHFQISTEIGDIVKYASYCGLSGSIQMTKYIYKMCTDRKLNPFILRDLNSSCRSQNLDLVKYMFEKFHYQLHSMYDSGLTNLHIASVGGSKDVVEYLIENGLNVAEVTQDKRSVLHVACLNCHFELVKYLVEKQPSLLEMVNVAGLTNLHYAACGGSVDVVNYLIEQGMELLDSTENKRSVLHFACFNCHFELVKYLVEKQPSLLEMVDDDGLTNLHYAARGGSIDVVKYLIDQGMDVTEVSETKRSVLHDACSRSKFELVKYLLRERRHCLLQMVDDYGYSSLHYAALGGSVNVIEHLIAKGMNPEKGTTNKYTVLQLACGNSRTELVKHLAEKYPDLLQRKDYAGLNNLHHAAKGGSVEVVKYLIQKEINVADVTENKMTVLHFACENCRFELVKYLVINYSSLLRMENDNGYTSLHYAGLGGSVEVVRYLIENGMDVEKLTEDKNSMLHFACRQCHFKLVKYLVENHPGLLQIVDDDGFTNLHHTALGGSIDIFEFLITHGENVTQLTTKKYSVLHLARQQGHSKLVEYLENKHRYMLQMGDNKEKTSFQHARLLCFFWLLVFFTCIFPVLKAILKRYRREFENSSP